MTTDLLLTFNAGSSTVKIGRFEIDATRARGVGSGTLDLRKVPTVSHATFGHATLDFSLEAEPSDIAGVVTETFAISAQHFDVTRVVAVGHRVVHGGDSFTGAA